MTLLHILTGCIGPTAPPAAPPTVWATGPSHRIAPEDRPPDESPYFVRRSNRLQVEAAVNETVGMELVIAATSGAISGVELFVDDFISGEAVIPWENIRAYRHHSVTVDSYPNWYLRSYGLREPRSFPDALVPLPLAKYTANPARRSPPPAAAATVSIGPGRNEVIYLEISIPPHAAPGPYQSTLTLANVDGLRVQTQIELLVRDIYLRPEHALPVPASVQLAPLIAFHTRLDPRDVMRAVESPEGRAIATKTFDLLRAHGLSPYCDELRPRFWQDRDGAVVLDWESYDTICGQWLGDTPSAAEEDAGTEPVTTTARATDGCAAFAWPLPVDLLQPNPLHYDGLNSTLYAKVLGEYLVQAAAHFEQRGWFDRNRPADRRSVFVHYSLPAGINPTRQELADFRRLCGITRKADGRLAILSTLIPQSMRPFGWLDHIHEKLEDEIDIWATPARFVHPATLARLQSRGKATWLNPDRPPFSGSLAVEAPLTHTRSLPWQAFILGHEALWLQQTTNWPASLADQGPLAVINPTDGWLIYPGSLFGLDEPVPSARLKQLQTGLHEYQYLKLLTEEGRAETARLLSRSLIKASAADAFGDNFQDGLPGRRVDDPAIWDMARQILCAEAEAAIIEEAGAVRGIAAGASRSSEEERASLHLAWSRFLEQTRHIELWIESARIKPDPRPGGSGYIASVDVAVRNELRTPLQGRLSFDTPRAAAPTMVPIGDEPTIGPLREMQVARRQLTASLRQLPFTNLDGHHVQPVRLEAGPAGILEANAVFAIARARRTDRPIRVDGNLSDWPPGASNIAGDFRLIGASQGASRSRVESQTVAYFCHDGELLFVGIRAASPPEAWGRPAVESNVVEYEDLRPVSGDLVEILLDPTGTATRSDEMYHIVIKSTGDPVFERGVSVTPPTGKVRPWPGRRPAYSVSRDEEGWTAELAIPISPLMQEDSRRGTAEAQSRRGVWGLNLARLEPIRGEYSDWARAPRYCYDPHAMGNLVWDD